VRANAPASKPAAQLIDFDLAAVKHPNKMKLSISSVAAAGCLLGILAGPNLTAAEIDFTTHVKPVLEANCLSCHGPEKPKGNLKLMTRADALKGGDNGTVLTPGNPDKSKLFTSTILPADHDDVMPPKGEKLTKEQTNTLKRWITEGAKWPDGLVLKQVKRVDFVKDIQPILEFNCVACHRADYDKGGLKLESKSDALTGGEGGPSLVPGHSGKSSLYTSTAVPADDEKLMPPKNKNGPLPKEQIELLRDWIDQGAVWPDGLKLTAKKAEEKGGDEQGIVAAIFEGISAGPKVASEKAMQPYTTKISGTDISFDLVVIPSGQFVMGSPASEAGRKADEGPQHKVAIEPFWMGKHEVTWNEYELFMYPDETRKIPTAATLNKNTVIDAVTRPTKPYVEMSFGMGKDGFPAISMTQHAANKYCEWLSAKTGQFYRLPTEAEWEYACRAGTTTAYSFGDDAAKLGEYAWSEKNSDFKYQKVGKKKPNPWGLHDMHGNVSEWCLDQYEPGYEQFKAAVTSNPWLKQSTPYPQVARGGSWDDEPAKLRSAVRRASDKSWKQQDPQLPKSIWYLTDAQFLGFRVVRPLKTPTMEEMLRYWNNGVEKE
jgi:formylglycine-generating enzyme required for sulfatase activity/mono/diheme cytochrome c family protein